jgi:hypothetical protein
MPKPSKYFRQKTRLLCKGVFFRKKLSLKRCTIPAAGRHIFYGKYIILAGGDFRIAQRKNMYFGEISILQFFVYMVL